jgi:DNA modification methylase
MDAILGSLKRFGQAEPLIVHARTRRVIGGNGRLVAMRQLGWTDCDVVELDIDDLQATALGIALNRTAETAAWDPGALAKLLQELHIADAFEGVGFNQKEFDRLLAQIEQSVGSSEFANDPGAGELPANPVTVSGDLWLLGDHRLLCGDSANADDVDRLLAGSPVHLLNTDPPYNVKVEPRSNNAIAAGLSSFGTTHHQKLDVARHPSKSKRTGPMRPKDRPLANDFVSDEDFARMLRAWFGNAARVLEPGRSFYIWGGYANLANYPAALAESGLYFSQAIVWDKCHPVLTRKDFMGAFELAFYGWREGGAHSFFGPHNATDLWQVKKVNPQSMIHLTEKAVELATRAILYSSRPKENVLDLFGGSGSTLMGCEQNGRNGFLMELDMPYCDVIVERWQKATGKNARLESGESFAEVAAARRAS